MVEGMFTSSTGSTSFLYSIVVAHWKSAEQKTRPDR